MARSGTTIGGRHLAQCAGHSQRTGERCKRSAVGGSSTCYYHGPDVGQSKRPARSGPAGEPGGAPRRSRAFTTRELSTRTWPDYVRFFSQGNGWDHCGCTAYQGFRPPRDVRAWADKRDWNLDVKCRLVESGRAHGVLVYDGADPIGWCQFGPDNELPIRDGGARRRGLFAAGEERKWRITCFCTDPAYAGSGVAGIALRAALKAIARRGGGLVEAWPVAHIKLDESAEQKRRQLRRWYNKFVRLRRDPTADREALERHIAEAPPGVEVVSTGDGYDVRGVTVLDLRGGRQVQLDGIGTVSATGFARFHGGTTSMFQREGFRAVSVLPPSKRVKSTEAEPSRIIMQKVIDPATT